MKKISKRIAKNMFNKGLEIILCPSKLNPNGIWFSGISVTNENEKDLEKILNNFSYYNCTKETGLRINFYTK